MWCIQTRWCILETNQIAPKFYKAGFKWKHVNEWLGMFYAVWQPISELAPYYVYKYLSLTHTDTK